MIRFRSINIREIREPLLPVIIYILSEVTFSIIDCFWEFFFYLFIFWHFQSFILYYSSTQSLAMLNQYD